MPRRDDDREVVHAMRQTMTSETGLNIADALLAVADSIRECAAAMTSRGVPADDEFTIQPVDDQRPGGGGPIITQTPAPDAT
jgi:hypothetical protein